MATHSLNTFASKLVGSVSTPAELLSLLQREIEEVERGVDLELFRFDERRSVITLGSLARGAEVAFDLLPRPVRKAVADGRDLADLKDLSADFVKLLGIKPRSESGSLLLKGMSFDADLCWVLALYVPKRLFGGGSSVVEKLLPYVQLFELGLARVAEHQARVEATSALERITTETHAQHCQIVSALKSEAERLRAALAQSGKVDPDKIAHLESIAARATAELRTKTERLVAVEAQVTSAVAQLEKAHLELHRQRELLKEKSAAR